MTTQPALDLDRGRRRLAAIDARLAVHARHLHQHTVGGCPNGCSRLLILNRINELLEQRLKEM